MQSTPPQSTPRLLNVEQAAAELNLSTTAVHTYLTHPDIEQRIPAFRHGRLWCIPAHRLIDWIDGQVLRAELYPSGTGGEA